MSQSQRAQQVQVGGANDKTSPEEKAKATAKAFVDGFQAPDGGHRGKKIIGIELLDDEVVLAAATLDKSLEPTVKTNSSKKESGMDKKEEPTGCCGCCGCCAKPAPKVAPTIPAAAGSYQKNTYLLVVTNQRIIVREEGASAQHSNMALTASASVEEKHGCLWYMFCCCLCCGTASASAKSSVKHIKTVGEKVITERMYLASDLKDVGFTMIEKREVEDHAESYEAAAAVKAGCMGCCGAPPETAARSEEQHTEVTYIQLDIKLNFVKKVGDYQGRDWQWFDGIKASHTEEVLRGTLLDPNEGHALRRALMLHVERVKPSVATAANITVAPGPGGNGGMFGGRGSKKGAVKVPKPGKAIKLGKTKAPKGGDK